MIFIDFDETLVKTCYSEYAYSLLVAYENNSDDQIERLHARRARAQLRLYRQKTERVLLDRVVCPSPISLKVQHSVHYGPSPARQRVHRRVQEVTCSR
jgi:hypothetical protein